MDQARPPGKRRWRRVSFVLLLATVAGGLGWYGPRAVGHVASRRVYLVPSGSMAPAILPGDRIVADIRGGSPGRGEIWTFSGPGSVLIKRVVGLPGETIEVAGGRVLVDGQALAEAYLAASTTTAAMPPTTLGPDEYFVMGDARNAGADSRAWGPVRRGQFLGRAEHRVWPTGRIGPVR